MEQKARKIILFGFFLILLTKINLSAQLDGINFSAFESVQLSNLEYLNTRNIEFAPTIYKEGLVFVSSNRKGRARSRKSKNTFFDLWLFNMENDRGSVQVFSQNIRNNFHLGPCTFNSSGTVMYYSQSDKTKKSIDGQYQMKLSIAQYTPQGWVETGDFEHNGDSYSIVHPSLSQDEKLLIFSSNMPGGFGKWDLYFSIKTDTGWSNPRNLGPLINSEENDMFPHLYNDNWLFYSSNGLEGHGGFDLYISKLENDIWSYPENLGQPLNSDKDDMGFFIDRQGDIAYLSSDREGGHGKDDIYKVNFQDDIIIEPLPIEKEEKWVEFDINIMDKSLNLPIADASVVFIPMSSLNNFVDSSLLKDSSFQFSLNYFNPDIYQNLDESIVLNSNENGQVYAKVKEETEYLVGIFKDDYIYEQTQIDPSVLIPEIFFLLEKAKFESYNNFKIPIIPGGVAEYNGFLFDSDIVNFSQSYMTLLEAIKFSCIKYPALSLTIEIHTDSRMESDSSLSVSKMHAEQIEKYLLSQGILPNRFTVRGLGEELIKNHCINNIPCSEEEHAINNRIVIRFPKP